MSSNEAFGKEAARCPLMGSLQRGLRGVPGLSFYEGQCEVSSD